MCNTVGGKKITNNNFYERSYPAVWNQYCLLEERLNRINRQLEVLLIITGGFFAVYSYQAFSQLYIFLPSLIGYALIYLLSLYFILPRLITIPWVGHYNLQFEKYRKKNDIEGLYKQLVTETYKYEYDLRFVFKRKKKLLRWVIIILIFSTFFPLALLVSYYSQILAFSFTAFIGLLILFFYKRFGTYLLKYFKSGDTPGKGNYKCLYCRKGYELDDNEKLKKCRRCGQNDFVKVEKTLSQKFTKFEKILFFTLLFNIIILLLLDGPLWELFCIILWILIFLIIAYYLVISLEFFTKPAFSFIIAYVNKKEKPKKDESRFTRYIKNFNHKFLKMYSKYFSILITVLIIVTLLNPLMLFPSFITSMAHLKAESNKPKLHLLVDDLTKYADTDEEKTLALLTWFDVSSHNIYDDWDLWIQGKTNYSFYENSLLKIYSIEPYICFRNFNDDDSLWILTTRYGRCGEFSLIFRDMARDADLTVRRVRCSGENHDWNEVLIDDDWVIVDATAVNLPNNNGIQDRGFMERKAGGNVSYVYAYPNDVWEDITYRYSNTTNITIFVKDIEGNPMSNAMIKILSNNRDIGRDTDLENQTNSSGYCSFTIGGGNYTFIGEKQMGNIKLYNKITRTFSEDKLYHNFTITLE